MIVLTTEPLNKTTLFASNDIIVLLNLITRSCSQLPTSEARVQTFGESLGS